MPQLTIHFSSDDVYPAREQYVPVRPSACRSEIVDFNNTAGTGLSTLSAGATDSLVDITTDANCWVKVGDGAVPVKADPAATDPAGNSWYMAAGERITFKCITGDLVSVIAA